MAISLFAHGLALAPVQNPTTVLSHGTLRAHLRQPTFMPAAPSSPEEIATDSAPTPPQPVERTYDRTTSDTPYKEISPPQAMDSGVDKAGLRQYHFALGRVATNFRTYPRQAREAGWGGRVTMRLTVSAGGVPQSLKLLNGSGYEILDQSALEMLRLAASHTSVPDALQGQSFEIDLAIDYNPADPAPSNDRQGNPSDQMDAQAK